MADNPKEQEYREEAARLAQLPRKEQRQIVAMLWKDAPIPKLPQRTGNSTDRAPALWKSS